MGTLSLLVNGQLVQGEPWNVVQSSKAQSSVGCLGTPPQLSQPSGGAGSSPTTTVTPAAATNAAPSIAIVTLATPPGLLAASIANGRRGNVAAAADGPWSHVQVGCALGQWCERASLLSFIAGEVRTR